LRDASVTWGKHNTLVERHGRGQTVRAQPLLKSLALDAALHWPALDSQFSHYAATTRSASK
jgi:hypothetical protein